MGPVETARAFENGDLQAGAKHHRQSGKTATGESARPVLRASAPPLPVYLRWVPASHQTLHTQGLRYAASARSGWHG